MANGHGGKRPGAGKPKGVKWASTLEKQAARELVRETITAELGPMLRAQIASATGIQEFFLRDPLTKQFRRVTDPEEIERALNAGDENEYYWIFTKPPNVQAFTDLMNRALDKPADHVKLAGEEEPVELIVSWAGGYAAQSPGSSSTDGEDDRHRENIKVAGLNVSKKPSRDPT